MKKILIADDERHVIRVMKHSLERNGYAVEGVPNGAVALERILEDPPDVLITDIQMPRMTGMELCRKIEEALPNREFRIFVATSRTELEHRDWTRGIANLAFTEKPISMRKLLAELRSYFDVPERVAG